MKISSVSLHNLLTKQRRHPVVRWACSGWGITIIGSLVMALSVYATYKVRPFTSDDVELQTVLHSALHGRDGRWWLGIDNFVIKVPIYAALDLLGLTTRRALAAISLVFTVGGFALFTVGARYFLKRWRVPAPVQLGLFVWLAAIGGAVTDALMNPNVRNLEVGIAVCVLALVARFSDPDARLGRHRVLGGAIAAIALGLFCFSDPYFLFDWMLPLVGGLVIWRILNANRTQHRLMPVVVLMASIILFAVWKKFFAIIGLPILPNPTAFSGFSWLTQTTPANIEAFMMMFGGHIFGQKPATLEAASGLINLVLLGVIVTTTFRYLNPFRRTDAWAWITAWLLAAVATIFFLCQPATYGAGRYAIMAPFCGVLLLGYAYVRADRDEIRWLLAGVLLLATVANTGLQVQRIAHAQGVPNGDNAQIIAAVRATGVSKGYAPYWNANINTYLSGFKQTFLPAVCLGGKVERYNWLVNDGEFSQSAHKTFFVTDSQDACTTQVVEANWGKPLKASPVTSRYTVLVYDKDYLGGKNAPAFTPAD